MRLGISWMGRAVCAAVMCVSVVSFASADVFNMGTGLTSLETVPVGNPGNAADTHGDGYGAVAYEYNIGKYEVTAGQYTEFLNAVAASDTYGLYNEYMWDDPWSDYGCRIQRSGSSGSFTYNVAGDWANRPVNYVSWGDAARFANWLHNGQPTGGQDLSTTEDGAYYLNGATSDADLLAVSREADWTWAITSEDEWYKAAYHKNDGATSNYFDYPTSSDTAPGYVNDDWNLSTTGTPFVEGGTDPGNYATYNGDSFTEGIGSPYYLTVVGEWENSESPYGTFDQGGNVWEWNEAIRYGSYRGLRGGAFYNNVDSNLHASKRISSDPTVEGYGSFGFRVSSLVGTDPEPDPFVGTRQVVLTGDNNIQDGVQLVDHSVEISSTTDDNQHYVVSIADGPEFNMVRNSNTLSLDPQPANLPDHIALNVYMMAEGDVGAMAWVGQEYSNPADISTHVAVWAPDVSLEAEQIAGVWSGQSFGDPNLRDQPEQPFSSGTDEISIADLGNGFLEVEVDGQLFGTMRIVGNALELVSEVPEGIKHYRFLSDGHTFAYGIIGQETYDIGDVSTEIGLGTRTLAFPMANGEYWWAAHHLDYSANIPESARGTFTVSGADCTRVLDHSRLGTLSEQFELIASESIGDGWQRLTVLENGTETKTHLINTNGPMYLMPARSPYDDRGMNVIARKKDSPAGTDVEGNWYMVQFQTDPTQDGYRFAKVEFGNVMMDAYGSGHIDFQYLPRPGGYPGSIDLAWSLDSAASMLTVTPIGGGEAMPFMVAEGGFMTHVDIADSNSDEVVIRHLAELGAWDSIADAAGRFSYAGSFSNRNMTSWWSEWGVLEITEAGDLILTIDDNLFGDGPASYAGTLDLFDEQGRISIWFDGLGETLEGCLSADGSYFLLGADSDDMVGYALATRIAVEPEAFIAGDADMDGDVDPEDLATLGLNWNPGVLGATWAEGDFNGDGMVDPEDLALLGLNWSPGGYAAIPEPASLGLLAMGGVSILRRRK